MSIPTIGIIHDWHDPHNEDCPQNQDWCLARDCTCKRKRNRKPYRVVKVTDRSVNHGVRPRIVAEVWPDGTLVLREQGRRLRTRTTLGTIYENCLLRDARRALALKREAKAKARKARKESKRKR